MNSVSQRKTDTKYHTVAFICEFFESSKPRYTLLTTENKLINTRGRWGDGESGDRDSGGHL